MRVRLRLAAVVAAAGICAVAAPAARGNSVTPICTTDQTGQRQCASGWYTTPVVLSWQWSPVAGASPGPECLAEQQFDADTLTTVRCAVTWPATPPELIYPYTVRVEMSQPTATTSPARPPDSNGWYNHPVAASVSGSAFSGIASCSAPTYAGPDSTTAQITGTCLDNAGKTATAATTFRYDSTPPTLRGGADPGDGSVRLQALASDLAPVARIDIVRSPGIGHAKRSMLHSGAGSFADTRVRNGYRYEYTFIAHDVAGNASQLTLTVVPGPRLLSPPAGAALIAPPMLRWTPVRHATYYNVQLYGSKKLLSLWPTHASLQLRGSWTFARHHYRLRPGRYRWYVWPGFGAVSEAHYGRLIGSRTFSVVG